MATDYAKKFQAGGYVQRVRPRQRMHSEDMETPHHFTVEDLARMPEGWQPPTGKPKPRKYKYPFDPKKAPTQKRINPRKNWRDIET